MYAIELLALYAYLVGTSLTKEIDDTSRVAPLVVVP